MYVVCLVIEIVLCVLSRLNVWLVFSMSLYVGSVSCVLIIFFVFVL